jgi:hypothetical protein
MDDATPAVAEPNKWLQALYNINDKAADTVLFLSQEYPGLALIVLALILYLSTVVKVNGISLLEGVLAGIPRLLVIFFEGFREWFANWARDLYDSGRKLNSDYQLRHNASMSSQTLLAFFFTFVAFGAMFVNFGLIYRPLVLWFGSGAFITPLGPVSFGFGAAMIIILMELAFGKGFSDAVHHTSTTAREEGWRAYLRSPWVIISFLLLLAFAVIEAYLAILREQLVSDGKSLEQYLKSLDSPAGATAKAADTAVDYIPAGFQALLGFIFPFLLAYLVTFFERAVTILTYWFILVPAIIFDWLSLLFRLAVYAFELISSLLIAFVGVVARFLGIVFWPFEQLAKAITRALDRDNS